MNHDRRVEELYLIRSYDHYERIELPSSRRPTRRSTHRNLRSNTETSVESTRRSQRSRLINYDSAQKFNIWEVARAATAAPFYFEPLEIKVAGSSKHMIFTDGGFSHHTNPTMEGTREIEGLHGANSIGVVVSIGTARDEAKKAGWIKPKILNIAKIASNPEVTHDSMLEKVRNDGFDYYRFNDTGRLKMELDDWKPRGPFAKQSGWRTLKSIRDAFNDWVARPVETNEFRECARSLVTRRQARANDPDRWEQYATGARWRCHCQGCEREDFVSSIEFKRHLVSGHQMSTVDADAEAKLRRESWRYQKARPPSL